MWSVAVAFALCLAYVGAVAAARGWVGATLSRDHPKQIVARTLAVCVVCSIAWIPTARSLVAVDDGDGAQRRSLLRALGLAIGGIAELASAAARGVATACLLVSGSIGELAAEFGASQLSWTSFAPRDIPQWRDWVVAPVTEEFFFRACLCSLLRTGGMSARATVACSAALFSLCHVSRLADLLLVSEPKKENNVSGWRRFWRVGLATIGPQLGFTSLFGAFASALFLSGGGRGRHLAAPLVAHVLCNWVGAPETPRGVATSLVGTAVAAALVGSLWFTPSS